MKLGVACHPTLWRRSSRQERGGTPVRRSLAAVHLGGGVARARNRAGQARVDVEAPPELGRGERDRPARAAGGRDSRGLGRRDLESHRRNGGGGSRRCDGRDRENGSSHDDSDDSELLEQVGAHYSSFYLHLVGPDGLVAASAPRKLSLCILTYFYINVNMLIPLNKKRHHQLR